MMQNSVPLSLIRQIRSFSLRSLIIFLSTLLMLDHFFRGTSCLMVAWSLLWILHSLDVFGLRVGEEVGVLWVLEV